MCWWKREGIQLGQDRFCPFCEQLVSSFSAVTQVFEEQLYLNATCAVRSHQWFVKGSPPLSAIHRAIPKVICTTNSLKRSIEMRKFMYVPAR